MLVLAVSVLVVTRAEGATAAKTYQSPTLISVDCKLTTGSNNGDSLDNDSTLIFVLHPTHDGRRDAEYQFLGRDGTGGSTNNGDVKTFSLNLHTNTLTRDQIDGQYSIDIIINAVGRDHYAGHLEAIFHFSDGSFEGFDYDFAIGTFHESNQTGKVVNFPPVAVSAPPPQPQPQAPPFNPACMVGDWKEQYDNPFVWHFTLLGDTFTIERADHFVSGVLTRSGNTWSGQLVWKDPNHTVTDNFVLTPRLDCSEVRTNQAWWYHR
jgi:hypothetical protein